MDEAEEVFDVELTSGYESPEGVHPGEEPLDLPAFAIAAELAPVLRFASVAAVVGDRFNVVLVLEPLVELVRVVRDRQENLR